MACVLAELLVAAGGPLRDLPGERRAQADAHARSVARAYGTLDEAGIPGRRHRPRRSSPLAGAPRRRRPTAGAAAAVAT